MTDSEITGEKSRDTSRKQERGIATRHELIRSARTVFARDGFEHTRLEDIATEAGKSRGAFYANFKDKEDVFCAIFEEDIDRDMAELSPLLLGLSTVEQRIEALSEYLRELSNDRERTLLSLEFKLYAIRHRGERKRLAALHAAMRNSIPELNQLIPQVFGESAGARLTDTLAICGIVDGLAINHLFDPEAFDNQELLRYLKLCLRETLLGIDA